MFATGIGIDRTTISSAIKLSNLLDAEGRSCIYVPITENGACPVCRPVAPSPRRQARGDHLRLRRHERPSSDPK